jgi:adenylate kinase family enzyme
MKVYFACSVRGNGVDTSQVRRWFSFMESHGWEVLTRHMSSLTSAGKDLGHSSDQDIFQLDQALVTACDLVIAELSSPSTGSGFMIAKAVSLGKPVLALFKEGAKRSAMITGCPDVVTAGYADEAGFQRAVRGFVVARGEALAGSPGRKIFLAGPPGSGKGTIGARLAEELGLVHVSTGDLLRELVGSPAPHPLKDQIAGLMAAGQLIPADIMASIVTERLHRPDAKLLGFILDGYPPSVSDLANLESASIRADVVFFFQVSDATSVSRQLSRGQRSTDKDPANAKKRVEVFHQSQPEPSWFPDSATVSINAERAVNDVYEEVRGCLEGLFVSPRWWTGSRLTTVSSLHQSKSTRVHFHIDARDADEVQRIGRRIHALCPASQANVKIYPIAGLYLGPQTANVGVYRRMPNFHAIRGSEDEAFITGRCGDGDPVLMAAVLKAAQEFGAMAEMEEYLGEWTLEEDGTTVTVDSLYAALGEKLDLSFSPPRAADIPKMELHLGFDVPKSKAEAEGPFDWPIALDVLMAKCAEAGLDNGGWFVFRNDKNWAYRSNEFSELDPDACVDKLKDQAKRLREVLQRQLGKAPKISFSLEIVHNVWVF